MKVQVGIVGGTLFKAHGAEVGAGTRTARTFTIPYNKENCLKVSPSVVFGSSQKLVYFKPCFIIIEANEKTKAIFLECIYSLK